MLKPWIPAALAAVMLVSLSGCYRAVEMSAEQRAAIETDEAMAAGQRHFLEARNTVRELESQIASKDWERAKDSVVGIRHHLETIHSSKRIDREVKAQVRQLMPTVYALQARINAEEADSLPLTRNLITMFDTTTQTLVNMGFLATQGGGAGTTDDMLPEPRRDTPIVPQDELNEDLETPTNIEE